MKVQIRQGVFETNSSSTHAVSVCTKQQWEDYKAGKLWMNMNLQLLPVEDAQEYNNDCVAAAKARCERGGYEFDVSDIEYELYHPYDYDWECCNYEWYDQEFTLDSNKVVAFGYYGYDY